MGMLYILRLEDRAARAEILRSAEANLGNATWYYRGTRETRTRGAPIRMDRAWRTGRDKLFSIVGIRDAADCMKRVPAPGARSLLGAVR